MNLGVQGVDIYVDLYYDCSMLQNVEQSYVRKRVWMKHEDIKTMQVKEMKQELGRAIREVRTLKDVGGISQRKLAEAVRVPPSNMKYIEDGVNAPSPHVYDEIIRFLKPNNEQRERLDRLYSAIRETPPPDVCKIICENEGMNDVLRTLHAKRLDESQLSLLKDLLLSFWTEGLEATSP